MLNKIKDMIRAWLKIDIISNKAIGEINKTIGQLRNNELKALEYKIDALDDELKDDIKRCFEKINTLNDKVDNHINLGN